MGASESSPRTIERQEIKLSNTPFQRVQRISRRKNGKLLQGILFESSIAYGNECRNAIQYLKRFRHPDILKVLAQKDLPDGSILVEDAEPLCSKSFTEFGLSQIQSGLCSIGNALLFLHESAGISHNNLCTATIFVRSNGSFALAGFEYAIELSKEPQPRQRLQTDAFLGVQKETNGSLRDAYLFGQLIQEISKEFELPENLMELSDGLCQADAAERFSIKDALAHPAMQNDLATILDKLVNFSVLQIKEKEEFIQSLPNRLDALDATSAGSLLSKPLLSRPVMFFEESHKTLYPRFFKPKTSASNGILPSEIYIKYALPEILYIWRVRDIAVRLPLLKYLPLYIEIVSRNHLEKTILPEIHAGVEDQNLELVASSYEGLATCVRVLGPATVTGTSQKKLFKDSTPIQRADYSNGYLEPKIIAYKEQEVESNFHSPQAPSSSAVFSGSEEEPNDEWNEDWGEDEKKSNEESIQSSEIQTIPQIPALDTNRNRLQHQSTKQLDIVDVKEIQVKSAEEDFFADMAPEIKTEGTLIDRLLKEQEERSKLNNDAPVEKKKSSILFSLSEDTNTENDHSAAWDDDLNLDPPQEIDEKESIAS
ncbi:unnamed protein product, partial [Mesorhabditis belari]|uniref:Protein kinase domain-containing protein n=1 Tax=Mesorhabditis belari TaxID=2138241 RepID=A0AAF3FLE8_9BILA